MALLTSLEPPQFLGIRLGAKELLVTSNISGEFLMVTEYYLTETEGLYPKDKICNGLICSNSDYHLRLSL